MAQGNKVEVVISAKDQFSPVARQIEANAKNMGASLTSIVAGVQNGFSVLTGDFSKLGSLLGSLPGPIGAVGGVVGDALGKMLDKTIAATEGFRKLNERTGASVEFLSGFTEAADDVFVSSEAVSASLTIFAKKLGGAEDAMDGSGQTAGDFAKKLQEIGINTDDVQEALLTVADRFKGMKDGTEKTALAVQLFGKQGAELIPILNKGRDGINEMSAAAKEMGLVITGETVEAVRKLKQNQDELNDTMEGFGRNIAIGVIPLLNDFTKALKTADPGPMYKTMAEGKKAIDANKASIKAASQALQESTEWNLKATAAVAGLTDAYEKQDGPSRAVGQLAQEQADAFRDATVAEYYAKDAAEQLAAKQQFLADATNNVNTAFGGTPQAMDNAQKAMEIFKLNTGGTTKAQFEQQQAMEAIRKALDLGILSYSDAAKALIGLRDGTLTTEDAFKRAGTAGAGYRAETELLIAAADKLKPKDVTLTVHNRWDDGEGAYSRYLAAQDKVVTVRFDMVQGTNVETDQGGNTRAKGGPVKRNKPYLIGEQGPEMFVPYTSGYIVPNSAPYAAQGQRAAGASAGTFNVNNPSIIINSVNGAAIAQEIARKNSNVARQARAKATFMG